MYIYIYVDILANIGHFPWPNLAETIESTSTGQDRLYEPISRSLRPFVTEKQPGKAYVQKNRCFWTFWPISVIFGGRIWPKLLKGTSTGPDRSHEPIFRSLRPFVTKKQPGKAYVQKNRCFWTFCPISVIFGGRI